MRAGLAQNDDKARPALGAASSRGEHVSPPRPPQWVSTGEFRPHRVTRSGGRILAGLEWIFLLFGLLALDCYIWVNTAATLDQAYSDWAFDQTLRGLKPSMGGFVDDELGWLWHQNRSSVSTPQENAEKAEPMPPSAQTLRPGVLIGRLRIPRLNLAVMVREGAGESTLRRAVGHIPGTGLPGQPGNVGLAGHRDTFFRPLQNIRKDDAIDLETGHGTVRYVVTGTQIVSPRDVTVLKASGGKTLTLVTCYPFYYVGSAPKRFIVRATETSSDEGASANLRSENLASGRALSKRVGRAAYKRIASNRRRPQQPGS
ncbi:MAG TPA: class D sortase [Bryobacteraceae bacterium]|nr:class D sortase [Bryobacteraceae bacterium]